MQEQASRSKPLSLVALLVLATVIGTGQASKKVVHGDNVDARINRIVDGLRRIEGALVFPAHPRTRHALERFGLDLPTIAPLGYLDFAALASAARAIVTDSGGLQKEAYWYGVPCVTAPC